MNPPVHPANSLANETSPYLRQHAHNPVHWFPWGEEAIEKARREDKPIFLSIGYAACHWCHVMERESFENEGIAQQLNEHFVSIKVDREERPDIDEIYMSAVVTMTGQGGWPMSVFLTPALKPFYGGTYYPPVDMWGRPGFTTVLRSIADAWANRRPEIDESAESLTQYIGTQLTETLPAEGPLKPAIIEAAVRDLYENYDSEDGGWGGAPKFPSSGAIALLLRHAIRAGDSRALEQAAYTLERMARGGLYDQIGGGFHRYSVDAQWLVPHFEKMLYDNAQLSQVYLEAYLVTRNDYFRRVAEETIAYVLRDLRDDGGAFYSSEDADSEGEEGRFYVWKRVEVVDAIGPEKCELLCDYYNVRVKGNFTSHETYHDSENILHIPRPLPELAAAHGLSESELEAEVAPLRAKLFELRTHRERPGLDDKILTSWNGMMISALAQAGQVLAAPVYTDAAIRAAEFILDRMVTDGILLRTHRAGESRLPGYLEDYAFMANACVDLYESTFNRKWLEEADSLLQRMAAQFWEPDAGLFAATGAAHSNLIVRTRPTYDGAEPSGNSIACIALQRAGRHLDRREYLDRAATILATTQTLMARAPRGYLRMLLAADFWLYPPLEIAVVGDPADPKTQSLLQVARTTFVPEKIIAQGAPNQEDSGALPLLRGKTLVEGQPAAYVCRNYACEKPETDPEALKAALTRAR